MLREMQNHPLVFKRGQQGHEKEMKVFLDVIDLRNNHDYTIEFPTEEIAKSFVTCLPEYLKTHIWKEGEQND